MSCLHDNLTITYQYITAVTIHERRGDVSVNQDNKPIHGNISVTCDDCNHFWSHHPDHLPQRIAQAIKGAA